MAQAIQEAFRLPTLHQVLTLVAAVAGAAVAAQQHQMPIQIHSATVDSVAVEPHLMPPLRLMEAVAAVIALQHQTLRHSHMQEAVEDLIPQHQMQGQALLQAEVVLQGRHLKPKAIPILIITEGLVAVLVLALHLLGTSENITISKSMWVADSVVSLEATAVEDLDQEEVEYLEDSPKPAAMLLVKQVVLIKDMVSMEEVDSVVLMDSAEVMVGLIMKFLVLSIKEVLVALKVHQEEVNPVHLVTQAVSRVVDSEVSILLELILRLTVVRQVNQAVS